MGIDDKIGNEAQNLKGKAKEATGKVTKNPNLEAEGQADQAAADAKKLAEKSKDTLR